MVSITRQLRSVGQLLGLDCGDNSCIFTTAKGGMRTNGGCRCDLPTAVQNLKAACLPRYSIDAVDELVKYFQEDINIEDAPWLQEILAKVIASREPKL